MCSSCLSDPFALDSDRSNTIKFTHTYDAFVCTRTSRRAIQHVWRHATKDCSALSPGVCATLAGTGKNHSGRCRLAVHASHACALSRNCIRLCQMVCEMMSKTDVHVCRSVASAVCYWCNLNGVIKLSIIHSSFHPGIKLPSSVHLHITCETGSLEHWGITTCGLQ